MKSYMKKCWKPAIAHTVSSLFMLAGILIIVITILQSKTSEIVDTTGETVKVKIDPDDGLIITGLVLLSVGFVGYMSAVIVLLMKKCYKVLAAQTVLNIFGIPA